jgi:polysaccharide pyruvyl transferase WcaK-like protein
MKILVYGWYGKRNIGDESYKLLFPRLFSDHELTFTDVPTAEQVAAHDAIILGGGNILNQYHIETLLPFAGQIPMVAFSVGWTDDIIFSDLEMFSEIYVRDFVALRHLTENGVKCSYCPDAAFSFEPNVSRGRQLLCKMISEEVLEPASKTVGVIVNGHLAGDAQANLARDMYRFQTFSYDLAHVLDRQDINCVFLPMMCRQPWDDRTAGGWVASRCKRWNRNAVVYDRLSVQDTLDVISAMDAVVSTRLHSSIFATLAGVPFVDIWHHDKNLSFLETVGRTGWAVPFWDFSRERTHELLAGILGNADHEKEGLREIAAKKRELLVGTVNGIHFN